MSYAHVLEVEVIYTNFKSNNHRDNKQHDFMVILSDHFLNHASHPKLPKLISMRHHNNLGTFFFFLRRKLNSIKRKTQPKSANKTETMGGGTSSLQKTKPLTCVTCLTRL